MMKSVIGYQCILFVHSIPPSNSSISCKSVIGHWPEVLLLQIWKYDVDRFLTGIQFLHSISEFIIFFVLMNPKFPSYFRHDKKVFQNGKWILATKYPQIFALIMPKIVSFSNCHYASIRQHKQIRNHIQTFP